MNSIPINYYELLGVSQDATINEIRTSYAARLANIENDVSGRQQALQLQQALEVLCDSTRRAAFDQTLARESTSAREPLASSATSMGWRCDFCGYAAQSRSVTWADLDCPTCASPLEIPPRDNEAPQRSANERLVTRYARQLPIVIESNWPNIVRASGYLLDLSTHGLRFASTHAFRSQQILRLDCELLTCIGRVAHSRDNASTRHVVGIEFRTLRFKRAQANFLDAKT